MAKSKKDKASAERKPLNPEVVAKIRRVAGKVCALLTVLALVGAGVHFMGRYVERTALANPLPPKMVLKDRPAWMTDFLAESILRQARPVQPHSPLDHEILIAVASDIRQNPWIKKVKQVRRAFGNKPGDTIEIDCEYRVPTALVRIGAEYRLVDDEGIVLPETFTAGQLPRIMLTSDNRVNIRIIEGVTQRSPAAGQKWVSPELLAGIDLAKLLYGKSYTQDIVIVDVSNFSGRKDQRESQLVLKTRSNSEIRWGRPINAKDFFVEVSPAQKLAYLEQIVAQYKRVDAGQPWIDIRFDRVTHPAVAGTQ